MERNNAYKSTWRKLKVDDIKSSIKGSIVSGPFGSNIGARFFVEEGIPLIRGNNLTFGEKEFIDEGFVFITDEKAYELRNCEALPGDLIFTAAGTLGQVGLIPSKTNYPKYIISNKQLRLRCNPKLAFSKYLFYWFTSPRMREQIVNLNTGSSVPLITLGALRSLPVSLPPLPIQHKIAAILSAYDELIENNTRRIAILEEMAQSLYQEWFVRFRYPGHEQHKLVESKLGMIPEGWNLTVVEKAFQILGGGTPSTKEPKYWNQGDINWYSPSDLTSSGTMFIKESTKKITIRGLRESSARLFAAYSVMMTSRATIGVTAINTQPACTNQGFITCIPNDNLSVYQIYYWLLENRENISILASGATFKEINKTTFKQLPIIIPDISISNQFNKKIQPIFKLLENLTEKNSNLKKTRDLLLPKLISGEIDVEGLDIDVSGVIEATAGQDAPAAPIERCAEPIDATQMALPLG